MNKKSATKDRIKETAISLFNKNGAHSVTTNHIAAELGISPGNLYYHYESKQEIIREIFSDISSRFALLWSQNKLQLLSENRVTEFFTAINDLYFTYRFFYIELPTLLSQDNQLRDLYHKNQKMKMEQLRSVVRFFISEKIIVPFAEEAEFDAWVENSWILSDFRLSHFSISGRIISKESIEDGIHKFVFFVLPYLTKKGRNLISAHQ